MSLLHSPSRRNIALVGLWRSVRIVNGVARYDWNSAEAIARQAVEGWMKSPGHRANILTAHWKREGIGIAAGAGGKVYITRSFC